MANAKTTELQKVSNTALAVQTEIDFSADVGAGLESAGQEAFAIPFLTVLQKMSPQVDEDAPQYIDGAKPGMLYETVSGKLYDGKSGVIIIPCAYKRVFLRWGPRDGSGAGFKGELSPDAVAQMRADGLVAEMNGRLFAPLPDGSVSDQRSDRFSDTRNHFCLLYDEASGTAKQVLLSISSTQIKKSKALNSMLDAVRINKDGAQMKPPTFLNAVKLTTVSEQNDKGSWYGMRFELNGFVKDRGVYEAARAFHANVMKGTVAARYEEEHAAAPQTEDDKF